MNYYAEAIDIFDRLIAVEQKRELLLTIVKSNPSVIIKAQKILEHNKAMRQLSKLEIKVKCLAKAHKIAAVKLLREKTELNLLASKKRVEYLMGL